MVGKRRENSEQKASGMVMNERVLVTSFCSLWHNYVYVGAFTRQTMPVKKNVTHLCIRRNSEIPSTCSLY